MSHHLKFHRMHPQPGAGQVFIEDTWHKLIGVDLCLGHSCSGNPDPKNIRANLIKICVTSLPPYASPSSDSKKIRAEFIWFSRHKIGRRQQTILEREFGLNYGLSPIEVRRARLKNNFVWSHLIKFVLVFFDNTHIYNKSWEYHTSKHVEKLYKLLRTIIFM